MPGDSGRRESAELFHERQDVRPTARREGRQHPDQPLVPVMPPPYRRRGTNVGMSWQERLRDLGERLTSGEITTNESRTLSEGILADADAEAVAQAEKAKVHIPVSAAWEAPSGEMTQIVGTQDRTTVVSASMADEPERPGGPAA